MENANAIARLETIRLLNLERQRKFYAANKERVNTNKRQIYAKMRALYISNYPPPAAAALLPVREPSPEPVNQDIQESDPVFDGLPKL